MIGTSSPKLVTSRFTGSVMSCSLKREVVSARVDVVRRESPRAKRHDREWARIESGHVTLTQLGSFGF